MRYDGNVNVEPTVKQVLSGEQGARWTVRAVLGGGGEVPENVREREMPATVPGCVHTDLMDAGVIGDVATSECEEANQWVSLADWRYACGFEASADLMACDEIELAFESLDTIASVELNGVLVGEAANEFVRQRFVVQGVLRAGRNELAVTFESPLRHVREEAARLGPRPVNGDWEQFVMARKCASNFQWDWGPKVATCGVAGEVWLDGRIGGRAAAPARDSGSAQPVATCLPAVTLNTSPDELGSKFTFERDGKGIFCIGANWIPEGLWPRDRTRERVRARLEMAAAAGMNMIRVWGGGRYEPDWFYEICGELGLMVWQDFMFGCACYPEEEPIWSLVEHEARVQVARLARHKSVVLLCGGNECIWAHDNWGFKEKLAANPANARTWGERYYLEMLPRIVQEIAPGTPYWPNSPWSGEVGAFANEPARGDRHTWDLAVDAWRSVVPRFCSEFGHQSPPTMPTMAEAFGEGGLRLDAKWIVDRQRGPGGNARWYAEPFALLGLADGPMVGESGKRSDARERFAEWARRAHAVQAFVLLEAITWMRANAPRCMGALFWQLNDAWPGQSWSVIDSAGRPKPAYWAVKEASAGRLLTVQPMEGRLWLVACNDTDRLWEGRAETVVVGTRPGEQTRLECGFTAPARGVARVPLLVGGVAIAAEDAVTVRASVSNQAWPAEWSPRAAERLAMTAHRWER